MLKKGLMMNRMTQLVLLVSLALAGCGREQPKTSTEQVFATPPSARDTVGTRGTRDSAFLQEQLAVGDKQVGLARLASERATGPALKKLGEMLLRDHQKANEELRQIASRQQLTSKPEDEQLNVERDRLSKLTGDQFDGEYLAEMIADHEDAVRDLEDATKMNDSEIRQWAAKTLPILRRHLEEAQQLRKTLSQRGTGPR